MKKINKFNINYFVKVILSTVLLIAFISCSKEKTEENKNLNIDKELVLVDREIASTIYPHSDKSSSYFIKYGVAETLFKIAEDGSIDNVLAKGFKKLDTQNWEIYLKENVKFWSGKEVDAESVIASLENAREKNIRATPFLSGLKFKVINKTTIKVESERKNLDLPLILSYMDFCIINTEKRNDSIENMDLTGMYKVIEFEPKKRIVLEKNSNYHGEIPKIDKVICEEISDSQARTLAILSGDADIALNLPLESVNEIKNNENFNLYSVPAANTTTIYLNLQKDYLSDKNVRQALSWGLDRNELVLLGTEGQSIPVTTWISTNPKYKEAQNDIYEKYDIKKAEKLLDEAGWIKNNDGFRYKDGKPLHIKLMTWGQEKALGEAIQNQWTKLGIKVDVQYSDYSLIENARETGEWDALIEAWQTYGDEYALLSGQFSPKGSANYGKYNDAEVNALLESLLKQGSEEGFKKIVLKINSKVAEDAPAIFLYPRIQISATKKNLKGFKKHFRQFENAITSNLTFE